MLEFVTPFHTAVGKLKSPASANFDPSAWQAEYDQLKNPLPSDASLLRVALWIETQSSALREMPKDLDFDALGPAKAVILALAAINESFLLVRAHTDQQIAKSVTEGSFSFAHMISQPLSGIFENMSADDAIENAVDAAESWLFDAYAKSGGIKHHNLNIGHATLQTLRQYSIQRGLNDLWNKCYWQGWRLQHVNSKLMCLPPDPALETRLEAGCIRHSHNFLRCSSTFSPAKLSDQQRAHILPRTIIQVASGRRRRIRVGRPRGRSLGAAHFFNECNALEASYLSCFLERQFPQDNRLNCRLLLQAWHVVLDLAERMATARWHHSGSPQKAAENEALLIDRSELISLLTNALTVDKDVAETVVAFLTFKVKTRPEKGHRGLWSAPIVQVPQSENVALTLPVLAVSNAMRKVEAWLEKAGLDDSLPKDARGNLFEADYRKRICEAIARNDILKETRCPSGGQERFRI